MLAPLRKKQPKPLVRLVRKDIVCMYLLVKSLDKYHLSLSSLHRSRDYLLMKSVEACMPIDFIRWIALQLNRPMPELPKEA